MGGGDRERGRPPGGGPEFLMLLGIEFLILLEGAEFLTLLGNEFLWKPGREGGAERMGALFRMGPEERMLGPPRPRC